MAAWHESMFDVSKFLFCFDEYNDVPQGTSFHKKKSGPTIFEAFQRPGASYNDRKKLVECFLIQFPNLNDLRHSVQRVH